jgi:hypothetical protein
MYWRVGVNCLNWKCSTRDCSTLLAGNQLLDMYFENCSNWINRIRADDQKSDNCLTLSSSCRFFAIVKYRNSSYRNSSYRNSSYRNSSYRNSSYRNSSYRNSSYRNSSYRNLSYRNSSSWTSPVLVFKKCKI